jgi:hypothetical protein
MPRWTTPFCAPAPALSRYAAEQSRLTILELAETASQRAVTLAQERYDRGLTDYLNGGGWQLYQQVPDIRRPQPVIIAAFRRLVHPSQFVAKKQQSRNFTVSITIRPSFRVRSAVGLPRGTP